MNTNVLSQLYAPVVAMLVALAAFGIDIAAFALILVLGWQAFQSFVSSIKLGIGVATVELPDEMWWDAILIGIVYAVGVIVTYAHFPVIAGILTPWAAYITVINIISTLHIYEILKFEEVDDDEEPYEFEVELEEKASDKADEDK